MCRSTISILRNRGVDGSSIHVGDRLTIATRIFKEGRDFVAYEDLCFSSLMACSLSQSQAPQRAL
jgi:hypothetical protein